jgi:hypothetical protein
MGYPVLEDLLDEENLKLLRYFQYFFYLVGGADPNPVPETDLVFAQQLIEFWVSAFVRETKGTGAKPSIHYLLHVAEDCRINKCHFDVLSAFKYENALRPVKNDITSGNFKLEQIRNRMIERSKYAFNYDIDGRIARTSEGKLSMGWCADTGGNANGIIRQTSFDGSRKYKRLVLPEVQVTTGVRDSFVLIKDPIRLGNV